SASRPVDLSHPIQQQRAIIQWRRRWLSQLDASHAGFLSKLDHFKLIARDKAAKIAGSQDPTAWMDYGSLWMRRDYWESLCHRWATGAWQERSQMVKHNRAAHPEKNAHTSGSVSYATHSQKLCHELERTPTFRKLFDRTHKRKGMDDYVSESARTIAETYDRTMVDRYAEGTSQPDSDPEAWVDVAGGPIAPPAYASSSTVMPGSGGDDIRTLIREELSLHLGAMD
ncbi:hypothetical protein Taro_047648, partial [Colocasia esculenta]|nr:hypothetical protein [Colocasia esculenta]